METDKINYFPVFLELRGQTVLVLGAGRIAARRIGQLCRFSCLLYVRASEISEPVRRLAAAHPGQIRLEEKPYQPGLIGRLSPCMVIAATDSHRVNAAAAEEARRLRIPVSTADRADVGTMLFPGLAISGGLVCGVTSEGRDHGLVKRTVEAIRKYLETKQDAGGEEV